MRLKYTRTHRAVERPSDCQRIVEVLARAGFSVSLHEAEYMWEKHSDTHCASWLFLPGDDAEILSELTE